MLTGNVWKLAGFIGLYATLSGCDLLFGGGNDEDYDESPYEQTYTSDDFSWMQMPEGEEAIPCMSDSECSGEDTKTVCGSWCGIEPRCMVPGTAGTSCTSDFDCIGAEGKSDSLYRCILGVCEDVWLSSIRLNNEFTSVSPPVQTVSAEGESQPEGNSCMLYDAGESFQIVTMTPGISGSIASPGEGWWKIMIPTESLWEGNTLEIQPPRYEEAESFYFEDDLGLGVEIDTEFPAHYGFPDDYALFSAYALYVTPDGKACLGSGGSIVVESYRSEYYGTQCGYASINDPDAKIAATLRFEGVTCSTALATEKADSGKADEGAEDQQFNLQDGTVQFDGERGTPGTPVSGPGNYDASAQGSSGGNSGSGDSGGGDSGGGSGGGGSGSAECDETNFDQTPYFNDPQFDSFCWVAGMYEACGRATEKQANCDILLDLCSALGVANVCPYCK